MIRYSLCQKFQSNKIMFEGYCNMLGVLKIKAHSRQNFSHACALRDWRVNELCPMLIVVKGRAMQQPSCLKINLHKKCAVNEDPGVRSTVPLNLLGFGAKFDMGHNTPPDTRCVVMHTSGFETFDKDLHKQLVKKGRTRQLDLASVLLKASLKVKEKKVLKE